MAESELERFFDIALDLLVIAGFDDYYKRVNPALERALGHSREELLSRPYHEFVHPEDVRRSMEAVSEVKNGNDVVGFENRFICADGSVRWIQWNTRAVPEHRLVYCVGRDVTERKIADAQLREAHRLVESSRDQLAASRARIVVATDEARRRIARDLHDGAQQSLVHTVLSLKLAQDAATSGEDELHALVTEALDNAKQATSQLRELAHGILPAALTNGGLAPAASALASRMSIPVDLDVPLVRLPRHLEATAYFVIAEALTNVTKHANARHATVTAQIDQDILSLYVRDDGIGGARSDGSGLLGMADRVAAVGGRLSVESPTDGGTEIAATLPIEL